MLVRAASGMRYGYGAVVRSRFCTGHGNESGSFIEDENIPAEHQHIMAYIIYVCVCGVLKCLVYPIEAYMYIWINRAYTLTKSLIKLKHVNEIAMGIPRS